MTKPTTLTTAQIDALGYTEARKAVKATATGTWVSTANSGILKAYLKGEITGDEAKARTFGASAPTSPTGGETALLAAALKAAVQPQLDELASRIESASTTFAEELEEISVRMATKAHSPAPVELPPTLLTDIEAIKTGYRVVSDAASKRDRKLDELTSMVKDAIERGNSAVTAMIAPVLGITTAPTSEDTTTLCFERFCQPGAALKPVLIKGGQGSGKTYGARAWGKKFDAYIEFGFQPETMPCDMFGFGTAKTDWVDGPLTRAWRLAASGKKVFVLLDEIYRAQGAARQSLLTPFSAREIDGKLYYALNTGRPIVDPVTGVETTEEILTPKENLAVAATTNVGAKFDVNADCPAGKERFVIVHVEVEESKLRAVLSAAAKAKGFTPAVVDKIIAFWKECGVLAADSFIEVRPTTRILSEALLYAIDEADVPTSLRLLGMNIWVAETIEGLPETEQVKKVNDAVNKAFAK
jgi:hypothetical protein